jgi:hypothetical protein
MFRSACVLVLALASPSGAAPVALPDGRALARVDFDRHVHALLDRAGCNAGKCHGNHRGAGGLSLSLMAASPEKDHEEIVSGSRGRRLNFADPDRSLLLLKAAGRLGHGGGMRLAPASWEYQLLREWITEGARREPGDNKVVGMEVVPPEHVFRPGESLPLKVFARFADGTTEDVTCFSDFRVPEDEPVGVSRTGTVTANAPGDVPVLVFYRGRTRVMRAMVAVPVARGFVYPKVPDNSYIDRAVFRRLRRLNVVPSDLCSDEQFLRRVTIDVIGTLPTSAELRAFKANKAPDRRAKTIDELLAHPRHSALLATKMCAQTGLIGELGDSAQSPRAKAAQMAHDWFRKRFQDNVPYDRIAEGVLCATSREGRSPEAWQAEMLALEKSETGFGTAYARRATLDHYWRHRRRADAEYLEAMAERTASAFLGVRLECARCHDHPLDGWSPADHKAFAALFAQVQMEKVHLRDPKREKWEQVGFAREVSVRVLPVEPRGPRPRLLGGPEVDPSSDRRARLVRWMTAPDNPFFARHFVNCVWEHYFGVGLVETVDGFTSAFPPRHATLLDVLAKDFVEHKFDVRRLERTILLSRTYQLSAASNDTNKHDRTNFSHALPHAPMPRVAADMFHAALQAEPEHGKGVPAGLTAVEVMHEGPLVSAITPRFTYQQRVERMVRLFGRKQLVARCETEVLIPHYLHVLYDGGGLQRFKASKRIQRLAASKQPLDEIIDECFLATVSRPPRARERQFAREYLQRPDKKREELLIDVMWALMNTREFVTRH